MVYRNLFLRHLLGIVVQDPALMAKTISANVNAVLAILRVSKVSISEFIATSLRQSEAGHSVAPGYGALHADLLGRGSGVAFAKMKSPNCRRQVASEPHPNNQQIREAHA